eukprot:scaffold16214_cov73-Phaeocystis_antarctica.AAC.13
MPWSAATVSSSAISANAASSSGSILSGPELVAGAKWAGATSAARARFAPMPSAKNLCQPASIHVGCVVRCSVIGGAAPGAAAAALCFRSAPPPVSGGAVLYPLAALDGGPGGSESSRDLEETIEPHHLQVHVCSVSRENCVGPVSQQDAVAVAVEQHESSNEQHAEGQQRLYWDLRWRRRRLSEDDSDGGHLLDHDAQRGGGDVGGAEGGGKQALHHIRSRGGGYGDGGGDAHASGEHADRDERFVDARGVGDLLLQARLVVVREVADATRGRQREYDRL